MIRPLALILAANLVINVLSSKSFARTEESLVWTGTTQGGLISLTYGSLDTSKPPLFLLTCFNEMDVAVLDIFGALEGGQPGQKLTIELSGAASQSLQGETSRDDKTGRVFAEASDIEVKPILAVLKSPGPVTVKVGSTTKTLSDAGRADAVEKFSKECQLD
jgi:hypothetical protein